VVAREPAVLAIHPQHPLASRRSVPLGDLRDEPFVTLTRASRLRAVLETQCRQAGFAPRIVAETSDLNVMVQLVAEGIGVAAAIRSPRSSPHRHSKPPDPPGKTELQYLPGHGIQVIVRNHGKPAIQIDRYAPVRVIGRRATSCARSSRMRATRYGS
jgi:DNA-binding transcriptional LysR family regulator